MSCGSGVASNFQNDIVAEPPICATLNPNLFKIGKHNTKPVSYTNIHLLDPSYENILDLITNKSIVIDNIVKIENPYLETAYRLKKEQRNKEYSGEVQEHLLFHGTKKENLEGICTFNFDWRLHGMNKGHIFGQGVSFTPNATWATNYSDENSYHKVMLVAKVLVASACQGYEEMVLPEDGYDTSQKDESGIVIVKYEDNEFLPLYKIYYHLDDEDSDEYIEVDEDDYYEYDEGDYYDEDYDEEEDYYDDDDDEKYLKEEQDTACNEEDYHSDNNFTDGYDEYNHDYDDDHYYDGFEQDDYDEDYN